MNAMRNATPETWEGEVGATLLALERSRLALRHAARIVDERRIAHRLRRLARRTRTSIGSLRRALPSDLLRTLDGRPIETPDIAASGNPVGAVASALRCQRRLRSAAKRAVAAEPPQRVRSKLARVHSNAGREAAALRACLTALTVDHPPASHPSSRPALAAGRANDLGAIAEVRR